MTHGISCRHVYLLPLDDSSQLLVDYIIYRTGRVTLDVFFARVTVTLTHITWMYQMCKSYVKALASYS